MERTRHGHGRLLRHAWHLHRRARRLRPRLEPFVGHGPRKPASEAMQRGALVLNAGGGLAILLVFSGQIKPLLDLATTLSFLVAPVIAYWNLTLVTRPDFEGRPGERHGGFGRGWDWRS